MLYFSVLSSGSKANGTFVSDGQKSVLVDCGLSLREATKRIEGLGARTEDIAGILITHEHGDHVSGVAKLAKKYEIPVYVNSNTLSVIQDNYSWSNVNAVEVEKGAAFNIADFEIEAFSIDHDAIDPVGYKITLGEQSLVVVTDVGRVSSTLKHYLAAADALVLEFNHDPDMLLECAYPWELKQRIKGNKGHLSNQCAASLVAEIGAEENCRLQIVVAAHISEKSNTPELVVEEFHRAWGEVKAKPNFVVAGVAVATELFSVAELSGRSEIELVSETLYAQVVGQN
ncbi:MAG: MBL fold metallo-hydrolase [Deltaproteobacteria bacterium]|nr:MBL fold metallo-hydrolase [Deltaproteobacteria bacterium]